MQLYNAMLFLTGRIIQHRSDYIIDRHKVGGDLSGNKTYVCTKYLNNCKKFRSENC